MNAKLIAIFKKYQNIIIWTGASAGISIMLLGFIILPQVILIRKTDQTIIDTQKQTNFFNSKASTLSAIDTQSYKTNLGVALSVLPEQKDLPAMIDQIQTLLAKNKLQLNGIEVSNGSNLDNSPGLQTYQIKIDITGDTDSLKNFINQLKTAPLIVKLTGLEISASSGGLVQDTLTLTGYYQAAPTALGSIDQPIGQITDQDINLLQRLQANVSSIPLISSFTPSSTAKGKSNPFE